MDFEFVFLAELSFAFGSVALCAEAFALAEESTGFEEPRKGSAISD